jgi:hypothetical protein
MELLHVQPSTSCHACALVLLILYIYIYIYVYGSDLQQNVHACELVQKLIHRIHTHMMIQQPHSLT